MEEDDETTAYQLQHILKQHGYLYRIRTIMRWRNRLGWKFCGSKYCQSIRNQNVIKRKEWAERILNEMRNGYTFHDVIFTDECKVQLERHSRKSHKRVGFKVKLKGRHKHPTSVYVWAGISKSGPTDIVIFDGIMDAEYYVNTIMKKGLLASAKRLFPSGNWKLMQDNGNYDA